MSKKILRFTASWCQPCKMLAKNLETANIELPIEVIDIDEDQEKAIEYQVRSVPTLVMVENDTEVKRKVGFKALQDIKDLLT